MCENNQENKDKPVYVPLKRDWRGYLVDSTNGRIDYGGTANYSTGGLQKLIEFAFTKGIDYSFLQERKVGYTPHKLPGYHNYSRN